jgi:hypothetical protein
LFYGHGWFAAGPVIAAQLSVVHETCFCFVLLLEGLWRLVKDNPCRKFPSSSSFSLLVLIIAV